MTMQEQKKRVVPTHHQPCDRTGEPDLGAAVTCSPSEPLTHPNTLVVA